VQLQEASRGTAGPIEGLVEEVDTGKQCRFRSEDDLIRFLRERFALSRLNLPREEGTK
jgi:hypothetical protein